MEDHFFWLSSGSVKKKPLEAPQSRSIFCWAIVLYVQNIIIIVYSILLFPVFFIFTNRPFQSNCTDRRLLWPGRALGFSSEHGSRIFVFDKYLSGRKCFNDGIQLGPVNRCSVFLPAVPWAFRFSGTGREYTQAFFAVCITMLNLIPYLPVVSWAFGSSCTPRSFSFPLFTQKEILSSKGTGKKEPSNVPTTLFGFVPF